VVSRTAILFAALEAGRTAIVQTEDGGASVSHRQGCEKRIAHPRRGLGSSRWRPAGQPRIGVGRSREFSATGSLCFSRANPAGAATPLALRRPQGDDKVAEARLAVIKTSASKVGGVIIGALVALVGANVWIDSAALWDMFFGRRDAGAVLPAFVVSRGLRPHRFDHHGHCDQSCSLSELHGGKGALTDRLLWFSGGRCAHD